MICCVPKWQFLAVRTQVSQGRSKALAKGKKGLQLLVHLGSGPWQRTPPRSMVATHSIKASPLPPLGQLHRGVLLDRVLAHLTLGQLHGGVLLLDRASHLIGVQARIAHGLGQVGHLARLLALRTDRQTDRHRECGSCFGPALSLRVSWPCAQIQGAMVMIWPCLARHTVAMLFPSLLVLPIVPLPLHLLR